MTIVPAIGLPTRLPKPCITNAKLIPRPKYLDSTIFFRDKLYPRCPPPTKTQNSLIKIPWTKINKIKIILYINGHLYGDIVYKECHDFTRRSLKSTVLTSHVFMSQLMLTYLIVLFLLTWFFTVVDRDCLFFSLILVFYILLVYIYPLRL
jgi:hypothetical protein